LQGKEGSRPLLCNYCTPNDNKRDIFEPNPAKQAGVKTRKKVGKFPIFLEPFSDFSVIHSSRLQGGLCSSKVLTPQPFVRQHLAAKPHRVALMP